VWQRHRAFVRRHQCAIPNCEGSPIEFAHLRTAANSGVGIRPADWFGIPLCRSHHRTAHDAGHDTMARENGTTLEKLFEMAREFARRSPDRHMREAMKEAGIAA
jgi:hypothetical protein